MWSLHGFRFWDNFWYAGRYSQVNYSLLFYPLASLLGTGTVVVASTAGAASAFSGVLRRQWPALARGPAIAFAVLAPLAMLAGTWPFLLGLALALGAIWALQASRLRVAMGLVVATALAHPLALIFLAVVFAGVGVSSRGWWRQRRLVAFAAGTLAVLLTEFLVLRAFTDGGSHYPFGVTTLVSLAGFCTLGIVLTLGLPDQRALRAVFLGYAALGVVVYLMSSPIGANVARLLLIMATPLLLLPLAARGFRPRLVLVGCLAGGLCWQALPAVATLRSSSAARASHESYWYPVEAFLAAHHDPNHRVEVVATADEWEALYLARRGVPLARGWFRQDDWPQNAVLYGPLTKRRYQTWLRRMAIRYVLLPDDPLDYSARWEARRLRAGSGLRTVARLGGWTIYEMANPTPLATPRRFVRVRAIGAESLTLRVARAGRYLLRVRYTPYWRVVRGQACVAPHDPWATELRVRRPGIVTLRFDVRIGTVVNTVLGEQPTCAANAFRVS